MKKITFIVTLLVTFMVQASMIGCKTLDYTANPAAAKTAIAAPAPSVAPQPQTIKACATMIKQVENELLMTYQKGDLVFLPPVQIKNGLVLPAIIKSTRSMQVVCMTQHSTNSIHNCFSKKFIQGQCDQEGTLIDYVIADMDEQEINDIAAGQSQPEQEI